MPETTNDTERLVSGTIEWGYDQRNCRGYYMLTMEDDRREEICLADCMPINDGSDSDWIANLFQYDYDSVEHDREFIHVAFWDQPKGGEE